MGFLHCRLICQRMLSRSSIWPRSIVHTNRISTTSRPVIPPSKIQDSSFPSSSPCLMLPPSFNDDTSSILYNFYSLANNRVLARPQVEGLKDLMPNPIDDLTFCGSSHGWIALFNPQTLDLFIYNPISLRHIKLPPINNLPSYPDDCDRSVAKLVLSCSPDEDEQTCRAVMIYNCQRGMAFCCPGQSNDWTPIGYTFQMDHAIKHKWVGFCYLDFVYSTRQNLFFGINFYNFELETWDLSDLSSPRLIKTIKTDHDKYVGNLQQHCSYNDFLAAQGQVKYLVVADELFSDDEDDVLLVTRYVIAKVAPDGSYVKYDLSSDVYTPHMTIDFDIGIYDQHENVIHTGLLSLGDLALFIGSCSESVALSATLFPELKSNSIYFTDQDMETRRHYDSSTPLFGGHDIGIFNFENKTVSPCYYPCDPPNLKRIEPSPIWFFPRLPINSQ